MIGIIFAVQCRSTIAFWRAEQPLHVMQRIIGESQDFCFTPQGEQFAALMLPLGGLTYSRAPVGLMPLDLPETRAGGFWHEMADLETGNYPAHRMAISCDGLGVMDVHLYGI